MMTLGSKVSETLKVLGELSGTLVTADSHNKLGGNYKYASKQHLQQHIQPALAKHNCVLIVSVVESTVRSDMVKVSKKATEPAVDKLMTFADVTVQLRLQHVDEPEDYITCQCFGTKVDQTSDKSLGAHTVAVRYGIISLFNLVVVDDDLNDPDDNSSDIRNQLFDTPPASKTKAANPLQGLGLNLMG